MELSQRKRGEFITVDCLDDYHINIVYEIPLSKIVFDFFDRPKSSTRDYASLDYGMADYCTSRLVRMDTLLDAEKIDALSFIVRRDFAFERGKTIVEKLKRLIPRRQFEVPVQAAIGQKIMVRSSTEALRKNVLTKCYGNNISRKRKLLEKQREGEKRMKQIESVEASQEAFMAILKIDEDDQKK